MDGLPDAPHSDPIGTSLDYTSKPIKTIIKSVDNHSPTPNVDGTITFNGKWVIATGNINDAMMAMTRILNST